MEYRCNTIYLKKNMCEVEMPGMADLQSINIRHVQLPPLKTLTRSQSSTA